MNKNEIRHKLQNEIKVLDAVIKELASVRPNISAKQEHFEHSLIILINIKKEMQETLNDLKKDFNVDDAFTV